MPCSLELAKAAERRKREIAERYQKESEQRFLSFLSPKQQRTYHERKRIHVRGQDGNLYLMKCDKHHANIYLLDEDFRKIDKWCAYADADVPWCDNLLAQMMALQYDIERLRKTAIITKVKYKQAR